MTMTMNCASQMGSEAHSSDQSPQTTRPPMESGLCFHVSGRSLSKLMRRALTTYEKCSDL